MVAVKVGAVIRLLREEQAMSQESLARIARMKVGTLSELETGKRTPRSTTITKLAKALGVTPQAIHERARSITPLVPSARTFDVVAFGRAYVDFTYGAVDPVLLNDPNLLEPYSIPPDSGNPFGPAVLDEMQAKLRPRYGAGDCVAGGSAANTVWRIAQLYRRNGFRGYLGFVGKTARDVEGEVFWKRFDDPETPVHPIGSQWVAQPDARTARCLVLCWTNGKRSFAFDAGCADSLGPAEFSALDFSKVRLLLVEGLLLHLTANELRERLVTLMRQTTTKNASSRRPKIVVSLSDVKGWADDAAMARTIAETADIIVGNNIEQRDFRNAIRWRKDFQPLSTQQFVITLGPLGAMVLTGDRLTRMRAVPLRRRYIRSVGAGDVFLSAYLVALLRDEPVAKCLGAAIAEASHYLDV
jgi:sugar/nucleoside kinase (ribokinase family)/DNA-binding XRE family transcriptional regulator